MSYLTDIEIAQRCEKRKITEIAEIAGIDGRYLEQYGNYKAKVDLSLLRDLEDRPDGKLILVTAITPTPAGEGKTTTSVGLTDGLRKLGKNAVVALREPSLGPVFGIKGGAAGGGYAQVVPMEDINLHFTGDFHAIGAANNLLAAMLDNHIQQGNALGIDPKAITWKRAVDMNDRQLRHIVDGLGGRMQGVPREAATHRSCPWRTSTFTLPEIFTRSARRTTSSPPCWTTTSSRATRSGSIRSRSHGKEPST